MRNARRTLCATVVGLACASLGWSGCGGDEGVNFGLGRTDTVFSMRAREAGVCVPTAPEVPGESIDFCSMTGDPGPGGRSVTLERVQAAGGDVRLRFDGFPEANVCATGIRHDDPGSRWLFTGFYTSDVGNCLLRDIGNVTQLEIVVLCWIDREPTRLSRAESLFDLEPRPSVVFVTGDLDSGAAELATADDSISQEEQLSCFEDGTETPERRRVQ